MGDDLSRMAMSPKIKASARPTAVRWARAARQPDAKDSGTVAIRAASAHRPTVRRETSPAATGLSARPAAVSRAARTPAIFNRNGRLNVAAFQFGPTPSLVAILPNPSFAGEKLTAYELGYRIQIGSDADFTIVETDGRRTLDARELEFIESQEKWSPFDEKR